MMERENGDVLAPESVQGAIPQTWAECVEKWKQERERDNPSGPFAWLSTYTTQEQLAEMWRTVRRTSSRVDDLAELENTSDEHSTNRRTDDLDRSIEDALIRDLYADLEGETTPRKGVDVSRIISKYENYTPGRAIAHPLSLDAPIYESPEGEKLTLGDILDSAQYRTEHAEDNGPRKKPYLNPDQRLMLRVLTLYESDGKPTIKQIARRMGITVYRARVVFAKLKALGLVQGRNTQQVNEIREEFDTAV